MLRDGYTDLPAGRVAAIATSLEMRERPVCRSGMGHAIPFQLRQVERPDVGWYRELFRRIGEPWLWQSRLRMEAAQLEGIIRSPRVEVWSVVVDGLDVGLIELDFRVADECELAFFGLCGDQVGQGLGRSMMTHAIDRAWAQPIGRFWVHTCTLDHPGALGFYIRSGFKAYQRQLELFEDPRLNGTLAPDAAPQVPVIRG
ncbi:MAG: GNAT family N-acetyltransferase [Hyphomicrobiaceae bacterium]